MISTNFSIHNLTHLILYFTTASIDVFGRRNTIKSAIDQDLINFYIFDYNLNDILSIQNTFWNDDELSIFNRTLKVYVS